MPERIRDHLVIVGFGPAGQRVAKLIMAERGLEIVVVELARRTADLARGYGLRTFIGDATRDEVLTRLQVRTAACVVITIPDPWTARHIIQQVRALAPSTPIVVRARYHIHSTDGNWRWPEQTRSSMRNRRSASSSPGRCDTGSTMEPASCK